MKCQLCDKEIVWIGHHLAIEHKEITKKDYYDKFIKKDALEGRCKLENCNNETTFVNTNRGYLDYCCISHAQLDKKTQEKIKETSRKNWGTDHPLQSDIGKEKVKNGCIRNHGVTNVSLLKEVNKKKSQTLKNNAQLKNETYQNWREKISETWKQKSETELKEIHDKRCAKLLELYGDEQYLYHKMKDFYSRMGIQNVSQIPEVNEKIIHTWKNKTKDEIKEIRQKAADTCFQNHGVYHIMHLESVKNKIVWKTRKTQIERGNWLPDNQISDWKLYQRKVYHYTNISCQKKFTKDELLKRKLCGVLGGIQIDHKYSIKQGFIDGILPQIIGSCPNLEFVSWEENDKKKYQCSISKEELFLLYEQENNTVLNRIEFLIPE